MLSRNTILNRLVILAIVALVGVACISEPSVPVYYSQRDVFPNRDQILAVKPLAISLWSAEEVAILRDLWLGSLPPLPPDSSNSVADDPRAAALGHRLFFDARLSANQQIACATCHEPSLIFTDGQPVAHGTHPNSRNTITIVGAAYSPWLQWDGRQDSLWAQAIEPIESPTEQGSTRLHAVRLINKDEIYHATYEAVFGPLPDLSNFDRFPDSGGPVDYPPYRAAWERMTPEDQLVATRIYVNLGKAIAAYERLIVPGLSRFDTYVQAVLEGDTDIMENALTPDEVAGLRLFIGRANCLQCHNGPRFADNAFHNTGVPMAEGLPPNDGRATGIQRVLANEFNCLSRYSDAPETECIALLSAQTGGEELVYAIKTPTLRNVSETAPYMHAGQFATLSEVLNHYDQAPTAPAGRTELQPLHLSEAELAQLEAFLRTLSAPLATPPELLKPPAN